MIPGLLLAQRERVGLESWGRARLSANRQNKGGERCPQERGPPQAVKHQVYSPAADTSHGHASQEPLPVRGAGSSPEPKTPLSAKKPSLGRIGMKAHWRKRGKNLPTVNSSLVFHCCSFLGNHPLYLDLFCPWMPKPIHQKI